MLSRISPIVIPSASLTPEFKSFMYLGPIPRLLLLGRAFRSISAAICSISAAAISSIPASAIIWSISAAISSISAAAG